MPDITNTVPSSYPNSVFVYGTSFDSSNEAPILIIDKQNMEFLQSNCNFNKCKSSSYGACVHIQNIKSSVQRRVCGTECSHNGNSKPHFSYTETSNLNYCNEANFYLCGQPGVGKSIIALVSGDKQACHANISNNNAYEIAGLWAKNTNELTSNYSNFIGNTASNDYIIYGDHCNTYYDDCSFFNNDAAHQFYCTSDATIYIYDVFMDNLNVNSHVVILGNLNIGSAPENTDDPYRICESFVSEASSVAPIKPEIISKPKPGSRNKKLQLIAIAVRM